MKAREYCCCAIPVVNAGILAVLTEQFALGIIVGTLSIATPSIVGAATPSFAKWILAIVCYAAAGIQILGFIGVSQEKPIMFRRYVTLHTLATVAVFAVAAAWIAISASRHGTAQTNCITNFFTGTTSDSPTASEATTLCNIFPWIDVGIMGGLWVFFAACQIYFYVVVNSYSNAQQKDHDNYDIDVKPLATDIPMINRSNTYARRPSDDQLLNDGHPAHHRSDSARSVATLMTQPVQREAGGYQNYEDVAYPPRQNSMRQPANAYTQDPGPTPQYNDHYYTDRGADVGMSRPMPTQAHPGES